MVIKIPKEIHRAVIDFAAKSDQTRYSLNSVLIELDKGRIIFVACDTHRLVCYSPMMNADQKKLVLAWEIEEKAKTIALLNSDLPNRLELARDIDLKPVQIVLDLAAWKARATKIARSNDMALDLGDLRPTEKFEGNYPRYREVIPTLHERLAVRFAPGSEYESLITLNAGMNMRYLQQAAPILGYIGTLEMYGAENSAVLAEHGVRPWRANEEESKGFYVAVVIMPFREK